MIPYGKQSINQDDIDAVVNVLQSDFLTQGAQVPLFEKAVANYCNVNHAVATNSATSALHIACLALGVGQGDIVWTSPITFVASANCALYCGASIDFVDIDINTGNLCVQQLNKKLAQAKLNDTLPKAVIAVHLAGQSCDMEKIHALAVQYNFKIIEDASHAIGGKYQNQPIGNCLYSDITIFSFHPVKIITTAEGGIAVTNHRELANKLKLYRSHGIVSDQAQMTEEKHGPWYYQQIALGFNYRMTEIQAALGTSQLNRIKSFVETRNQLAKKYDSAFYGSKFTALTPCTNAFSSYHLYIVLLPMADKTAHKQAHITLREQGICSHVHYIPVHLQPYYQNLGFKSGDFPIAEEYYQRAMSLPLHPQLTDEEQVFIIKSVKDLI
jgi:UDP-4-amino-4,6-dideoxy-N-acetyl-beta-L-altrosamine transaminase